VQKKTEFFFHPGSHPRPAELSLFFPDGDLYSAGVLHHLSGTGSFIHAGQSPVQGMMPGTFLDMRISHVCGPSSIPVRTLGTRQWALFWEPSGNDWELMT